MCMLECKSDPKTRTLEQEKKLVVEARKAFATGGQFWFDFVKRNS